MHSHMVTGYRLFGGLFALHGLAHFLNPTGPSLTKVVYAYFDRISCTIKGPLYRSRAETLYRDLLHAEILPRGLLQRSCLGEKLKI